MQQRAAVRAWMCGGGMKGPGTSAAPADLTWESVGVCVQHQEAGGWPGEVAAGELVASSDEGVAEDRCSN